MNELKQTKHSNSLSSYESAIGSRSSTISSYDSAPPPLPTSDIPLSPEPNSLSSDDGSRFSTLSLQSYESSDTYQEPIKIVSRNTTTNVIPPTIPETSRYSSTSSSSSSRRNSFNERDIPKSEKNLPFSISTYDSRAKRLSYSKKVVRSESLSSFKDIIKKNSSKVSSEEPTTLYFGYSNKKRNEVYRSEEALHRSHVTPIYISQNQDYSDYSYEPRDESLKSHQHNSEEVSSPEVPEDFKSRWAVFESKSFAKRRYNQVSHCKPIQ